MATITRKTKRTITAAAVPALLDDEIRQVPLGQLWRHPDNRIVSQPAVAEMAAALKTDGQLEPLLVRPAADPESGAPLQIVSGETRWRAARELGWETVAVRLVVADHAAALRLLAAGNAHRRDLDPIARARLVARLCEPIDAGGAGCKREEAAAAVGLQSGSAATNLVRLLELPEQWLQRVAAGQLPESWARLLLPWRTVPAVLAELENDWAAKRPPDGGPPWETRDSLETALNYAIRLHTRPMDRITPTSTLVDGRASYGPKLFATPPAVVKELAVVTNGTRQVATNVEAWDRHQANALRQRQAAGDSAETPPNRPAKPTSTAAAAGAPQETGARRLDAWRRLALAKWITAQLTPFCVKKRSATGRDLAQQLAIAQLVAWLLIHRGNYVDEAQLDRAARLVTAAGGKAAARLADADAWPQLAKLPAEAWPGVLAGLVVAALQTNAERPADEALVPLAVLADVGAGLGADWPALWQWAQETPAAGLWPMFWEMWNADQLDELGQELGVHVTAAATAKAKRDLFCAPRHRLLPLPKCLRQDKRKSRRAPRRREASR